MLNVPQPLSDDEADALELVAALHDRQLSLEDVDPDTLSRDMVALGGIGAFSELLFAGKRPQAPEPVPHPVPAMDEPPVTADAELVEAFRKVVREWVDNRIRLGQSTAAFARTTFETVSQQPGQIDLTEVRFFRELGERVCDLLIEEVRDRVRDLESKKLSSENGKKLRDTLIRIRDALAREPLQKRMAYYLCELIQLAETEVAGLLGVSAETIRQDCDEARRIVQTL